LPTYRRQMINYLLNQA